MSNQPSGSLQSPRVRRQASMYVHATVDQLPIIESIRRKFNPLQASLIPAHVTLCREDEVNDWKLLEARIRRLTPIMCQLEFGAPLRDGNYVHLPVASGQENFDRLRQNILCDGTDSPRHQTPHMTLIHPRNGTCSDEIFADICSQIVPFKVCFTSIKLIEQVNDQAWTEVASIE